MDNSYFESNVDVPSRMNLSTKEIDEEMKEAEQMTLEMDHVSDMLTRLASNDTEIAKAAQEEIDNYLIQKEQRKKQGQIQKSMAEECKISEEKTIINNNGSVEEKCKKLSEEYKVQGNEAFKQGNYKKAKELYTSAILQFDGNHVIFTNRAQAEIQLKEYFEASKDCEAAIKLNPDSIKAHIHLAKALNGLSEKAAAIRILELAEDISNEHTNIITQYKEEIMKDIITQ